MDIQKFWHAIITQDKEKLSSFFADDAIIRWPCTNEQFTVEEYVRVNCEYPGEWEGEIECLDHLKEKTILTGHVRAKDGTVSCHVVSFLDITGDRISRMDEYWADDGEAPQWRKDLKLGRPIK